MPDIKVGKMQHLAQSQTKPTSLFHSDDEDSTGLLTITFNNEVLVEIDDMDPDEAQKVMNSINELKEELRKKHPSLFGD